MTVFWNYKKSKKETCQPLKLWYLCTHYYNTPLPSFLTFSDTRAVRDLPCAFTGVDHTAYWPKTQKSHISLQNSTSANNCLYFFLNTCPWKKTYLIILLLIEISSWNDFSSTQKSQWISLNMTWSCTKWFALKCITLQKWNAYRMPFYVILKCLILRSTITQVWMIKLDVSSIRVIKYVSSWRQAKWM